MQLFAPCFVLHWVEEKEATAEIRGGDLIIISPSSEEPRLEISPVVRCKLDSNSEFYAPQTKIPDDWAKVIVLESLPPRRVRKVLVQTWRPPDELRHLFPSWQWLNRSHWLLWPYQPIPKQEVVRYETDQGEFFFVYPPGRTEGEIAASRVSEQLSMMFIEMAFKEIPIALRGNK